MKIEHNISTDVLVIGGGVAATRAALSSAQSGAKTTIVLKKNQENQAQQTGQEKVNTDLRGKQLMDVEAIQILQKFITKIL